MKYKNSHIKINNYEEFEIKRKFFVKLFSERINEDPKQNKEIKEDGILS